MERTFTDVSDADVNRIIGALKIDGLTKITKTRQPDGLWTIKGETPGPVETAQPAPSPTPQPEGPSGTTVAPSDFAFSARAAEYIVGEEAFIPFRYQDVADNATIGYGHHKGLTAQQLDNQFPNGLTEEEAWDLMLEDVKDFTRQVARKIDVPLLQHQIDALVMVAYGRGNINSEAPLVNAGKHSEVADKIESIQTAGGQFNAGVAARYRAVAALYRSGVYPTAKKTRAELKKAGIELTKRKFPNELNTVGNDFDRPTEPSQIRQANKAFNRMTGETLA